ncbi:asparaginase [Fistulina hepatica ATCC 64428]|uniref:Asparaginase n=1 Tax=Fistulina hepatica ATCC 64428 TaxID=1128425 RepID=A0A0D7AG81_9AGAR|nr:asparaginase [Fistulina hepatica ATCC 64428]
MGNDKSGFHSLFPSQDLSSKFVLVIHGGAGTMQRAGSSPEQRASYNAVLRASLQAGYKVLSNGGDALDATVAAVSVLEDSPLFNAGKGAVFNTAGKNELEASVMVSKPPASHPGLLNSRRAMGVALLTHVKNPCQLAQQLYFSPSLAPHTFLSGTTAETLGASLGIELVEPDYFWTEHRWKEHRRGLGLPEVIEEPPTNEQQFPLLDLNPMGTVGAVALDVNGCIAAVTSTGGRTNKLVGRVGDTPIVGCGFWAEEWEQTGWRRVVRQLTGRSVKRAVGTSGTGNGDYFIRLNTGSEIARRMQYLNESVQDACDYAVEHLRVNGGDGGVVAVDSDGTVAMSLNCAGMYRGVIDMDGTAKTTIFADEELSTN